MYGLKIKAILQIFCGFQKFALSYTSVSKIYRQKNPLESFLKFDILI